MLAASGAGLFADIFAYPFLAMKTLQQNPDRSHNLTLRAACNELHKGAGLYKGFSGCIGIAIPGTVLYLLGRNISKDNSPKIFGKDHVGEAAMQGFFAIALVSKL